MVENGRKWSKMVQNDEKGLKTLIKISLTPPKLHIPPGTQQQPVHRETEKPARHEPRIKKGTPRGKNKNNPRKNEPRT